MSPATPISKFISNHAKVQLKEIKDMKIDRRKIEKTQKPSVTCQFDKVRSESF